MIIHDQWNVVHHEDHDDDFSYEAAKVVAGPFDTWQEAREFIDYDDRFIAIRQR